MQQIEFFLCPLYKKNCLLTGTADSQVLPFIKTPQHRYFIVVVQIIKQILFNIFSTQIRLFLFKKVLKINEVYITRMRIQNIKILNDLFLDVLVELINIYNCRYHCELLFFQKRYQWQKLFKN